MSTGKPFEPGNKFGRGRPKGSKNKPTNVLAVLKEHAGPMVSKCIADYYRGDKTSKQILIPILLKQKPAKFDVGPTDTPAALLKAYDKALRAFSKRKITPADGQALVNMLDAKRRAFETLDLEIRVQHLESVAKVAKKDDRDKSPTLIKKVA
jgi:hypothetical protein